jgi:hypothetical protein
MDSVTRMEHSMSYVTAINKLTKEAPHPESMEDVQGVMDALVCYAIATAATLEQMPNPGYDPELFQSITDEVQELIIRRLNAANQPQAKAAYRSN